MYSAIRGGSAIHPLRPSLATSLLLLLLFSGPPRFRERDVTASLKGQIDGVVIFHIVVWAIAGLWIFYQLRFGAQPGRKFVKLNSPQILGLALAAALSVSIFVSVSPALTAFKVYQILISLLFMTVFVRRYGIQETLKQLFLSSAVLCVALPAALLINPGMVLVTTETGAPRLRGDYIAGTEDVAILCLIFLLAEIQHLPRVAYGCLLILCCSLLIVSVSRSAYVYLLVVFLLVLFKPPPSKAFRRFAWIFAITAAFVLCTNLSRLFEQFRDPHTVSTLSDRTGLWAYLAAVTLDKSPFVGLGYYSASRVYALEYNPGLGTAHSMFVETLLGGGIIAATILLFLCVMMLADAVRVFRLGNTNVTFLVGVLCLLTLFSGVLGATLDSGPTAITFWSLAAILPILKSSVNASTLGPSRAR